MTESEKAWLAGIFEGEGCAPISYKNDVRASQPYIYIKMTDKDVINRIHKLFGSGSVYTIPSGILYDEHFRKEGYKWQIGKQKDVERFIEYVLPWLGNRRKNRLQEIKTIYKKRKKKCHQEGSQQ